MGKCAHIKVWRNHSGMCMVNSNFFDQSGLFCCPSDMHCISALAIEEGSAFESQME